MFLSEDENFLLLFRQETPLDSSVEFMRVSIWLLSLWRPGSQAPAMAATSLAHSPRESCHGTKPRKEALGVEPGLWPPVSMCSLSGLTYTAPELTDSLA